MIKTICVCGAGTMGSGIAQVAAQAGFHTVLYDVSEDMLRKAQTGIENSLAKLVAKSRLTGAEKEKAMANTRFVSVIEECVADLIIEAIVEKKEIKTTLFTQLASVNKDDTIFASNTSSISVTELANSVPLPQRLAGMHFFNPAPLMKLVEIVSAEQTDTGVIESLTQVALQMGKTPVVCRDAPGFIVNRVARPYYLEAMKMVEEGYEDYAAIDTIMRTTGFKMGPFELMDLIGMDINYSVSNIVWEALGKPPRLQPSPLQQQKITEGRLGRKTGKGFYEYNETGNK